MRCLRSRASSARVLSSQIRCVVSAMSACVAGDEPVFADSWALARLARASSKSPPCAARRPGAELGDFLGETFDLVLRLRAGLLRQRGHAQLLQLRPQRIPAVDLLLALFDVEEADRAVVVAEGEIALALVEVGKVVDELQAVGLLLEGRVRLELDRLLEVGDGLAVLLGRDIAVTRNEVVARTSCGAARRGWREPPGRRRGRPRRGPGGAWKSLAGRQRERSGPGARPRAREPRAYFS